MLCRVAVVSVTCATGVLGGVAHARPTVRDSKMSADGPWRRFWPNANRSLLRVHLSTRQWRRAFWPEANASCGSLLGAPWSTRHGPDSRCEWGSSNWNWRRTGTRGEGFEHSLLIMRTEEEMDVNRKGNKDHKTKRRPTRGRPSRSSQRASQPSPWPGTGQGVLPRKRQRRMRAKSQQASPLPSRRAQEEAEEEEQWHLGLRSRTSHRTTRRRTGAYERLGELVQAARDFP